MKAEFTSNLVTGNKTIDEQHKELISKINDLLDAVETSQGQATAMRMLNFLNDYVVYHFEAEENLQKEVGYPGLADHQKQHESLKQTVADLTEMLTEEEGASPAFVEQLNKKVVEWLYKHIEGYDRSVAEYIYLAENPDRY
ncbi:MAG: hemerythrin family protein [Eubacterium sp.]|nr:hemerythrin family protein [Eubacterium sp.]